MTSNWDMILGSISTNNFFNLDTVLNKKSATFILPIYNSTFESPIVKVFLNGLSLSANITKKEIDDFQTQLNSFKALSLGNSVIKYLQKIITQKQAIQFQILEYNLINNILSLTIQLGLNNHILSFLSISYVILNNKNFIDNSSIQYIHGLFLISSDNFSSIPLSVTMPSINHPSESLLLYGVNSFSNIKSFSFLQFNPITLSNRQSALSSNLKTNNTVQPPFNYISIAYLRIIKSSGRYCSNCNDGQKIFENYCVLECPSEYIVKKNVSGLFCQKCNALTYQTSNSDKTSCICSPQRYKIIINVQTNEFICLKCNYTCVTCSSQNNCLTCDTPFQQTHRVLNSNKQCACMIGYYDEGTNENIRCSKCHESCVTCTGPSQFQCLTCGGGKFKGKDGNCICQNNFSNKNGTCVCETPNIKFRDSCYIVLIKNACLENEVEIYFDNAVRCDCRQGYHRFKNNCVLCGKNEIIDNITGLCVCKMNSYKKFPQNTCIQCPDDKGYDIILKKCICKQGSLENSKNECTICKRRQILINDKCQCVYNYFMNQQGECQRCSKDSLNIQCKLIEN